MSRSFFGNEQREKRRRALSFSDVDQILADACLRIVNLISAKSMRSVSWISRQAAVLARVVIPMLAWIEVYGKPVPRNAAR